MKGKSFVLGVLLFALMGFVGCGVKTQDCVLENMSEVTKVFYFAENEKFYATLAIGQREKEYIMDGKSNTNVDFSLLSVCFFENQDKNSISVSVSINGVSSAYELEYNPMANAYMVDLEKKLGGEEKILISYDGATLELQNLSKQFGVNWEKAISIACVELKDKIEKEKQYSDLNGECYLKVMDKRENNFKDFFWCFTILNNQNESFSIIISTVDGTVLAKAK